MNPRGSIFGRVLAGCGLAVLVPVIVGFTVAYWAVGELAETELRARVATMAQRKLASVERHLSERVADVQVGRRAPWVREALAELTGYRAVPAARGRRGAAPPSAAAVAREQLQLLVAQGGCADAFLVTTNGDLVLSAQGRPELGGNLAGPTLRDSALTRAVLSARAAGQCVVSELRVHRPTGRPSLFVVGPVTGTGPGQQGFLGLEITAASLHGRLRDEGEGAQNWEILLAAEERDHVLILSPSRNPRVPPAGSAVALSAFDPGSALMLALRGGTGVGPQRDALGQPIFAWWGGLPRARCAVLIALDPGEAFAPLLAVRRRLWIVGGITLAFAVLAVGIVARGVARPIVDLADAADRVATGEPEARTGIRDGAELGRISEVLDQTLERLQASTAARGDLERQRQELRQRNTQLEEWVRALTADRDRRGGPPAG